MLILLFIWMSFQSADSLVIENDIDVRPLLPVAHQNTSTIETDSTLRWNHWINPAERNSRMPDRFTSRLTGFLRHDASYINGHNPYQQRYWVDGVDFRDPVTGLTNPNRLPHLHLARWDEQTIGTIYKSKMVERDYHVTTPLTWINYEQGPYNLLSNEVVFAANQSRRTGFSARYWGKNDDGEYLNSATKGRLLSARGYHVLSEDWKLHGTVLYNGMQTTEPNGYNIISYIPQASSVREAGRASVRQTVARVSLTHRTDWDMGVYHHRFRRFYKNNLDSIYSFYRVLGYGAYGTRYVDAGLLKGDLTMRAETFRMDPQRRRSVGIGGWSQAELEANASLGILSSSGTIATRSDGEVDAHAMARMQAGRLYAAVSGGKRMRSIQERHWRGDGFLPGDGSAETRLRVEAGLGWKWFEWSGFAQSTDSVNVAGGMMSIRLETPRWDVGYSGTITQNLSDFGYGSRVWNRAWIYWKGYLFNRATFVRTGFHATVVPIGYVAPTYDPVSDVWQEFNPAGASIPYFYRIDWDLSARVRNIFFLMRWEQLNQNAGQFGYEETAFYPMPGRGLRFGMRVVLRN